MTYTQEQIRQLPRGTVRYACFRQRSGNPESDHNSILEYYVPRIVKYGLNFSEFGDSWDISKDNNLDIVSGHIIHLYKEEAKTLFNEDGSLKE